MLPKIASSHDIQRNYRKIFDEVMTEKRPVIIYTNHEPQVVIIDAHQYEELEKRSEEHELQLAIKAVKRAHQEKKDGRLKKLKSLADLKK